MTRKELEALSNEELGGDGLEQDRNAYIELELEQYEGYLDGLADEELFYAETLHSWRDMQIETLLHSREQELEGLSDEDLLGAEYVLEMRQKAIEKRLREGEA